MLKSIKWYILALTGKIGGDKRKGERTLTKYQRKTFYTMAEKLAESGYIYGAGLIFKSLEWFEHSFITANNLAAFYEKYGRKELSAVGNKKNRPIKKDVIRYYSLSNKRRQNVRATCSLGYISYGNKNYHRALGYYKRALQLKKRAELYYNVAIMYFYMGKYSQAIRYIKKAIPGLKQNYQKEACLALIYIYGVSGYRDLARKYFRKYIDTYDERNVDLLYVAYVCQEYGYIDQHCFTLCKEEDFTLQDAELVIRVLSMVGKEKLANYFFQKWRKQRKSKESILESQYCNQVYEKVVQQCKEEYLPLMHPDPILHKKYYL